MFSRVVRETRLSDKVASRILEVIVDSSLRPGDALPSERMLGEQFGVSRTVVREALRSLAGKGVVEMTQGRALRITRVEPSAVRESMRLFLQGRPALDYARVHEVRALLETEVAGIAADRAQEADLARLDAACEQLAAVVEDPEAAAPADIEFHRLLAHSTHNELFLVLLDSLNEPLAEIRLETFQTVTDRAAVALEAHRLIAREVRARNGAGARAAMKDHLDDVLLAWRKVKTLTGADGPEVNGRAASGGPVDAGTIEGFAVEGAVDAASVGQHNGAPGKS
jgi:GntR family transcriptional regulator, transcriptional repressor for pyruvate dehydrogenase complex